MMRNISRLTADLNQSAAPLCYNSSERPLLATTPIEAATEVYASNDQTLRGLLSDYCGTVELAAIFRVSRRTIERWVRLRLLPQPRRLGRRTLFRVEEVREYLESAGAARRGRTRSGAQR